MHLTENGMSLALLKVTELLRKNESHIYAGNMAIRWVFHLSDVQLEIVDVAPAALHEEFPPVPIKTACPFSTFRIAGSEKRSYDALSLDKKLPISPV